MGPSRAGKSHAYSWAWAKIELVLDVMHVLVICKFDEDLVKNEVAIVQTTITALYVYGLFWLPWKPKVWPDLLKKLNKANPPTQWWYLWYLIKINQLAFEIFLFESVDARTDDGTLLYYKLTLWAWLSELIINKMSSSTILNGAWMAVSSSWRRR